MRNILFFLSLPGCIFFLSCSKPAPAVEGLRPMAQQSVSAEPQGEREAFIDDYWRWSFGDAGLPDELARKVAESAAQGPDFVMQLLEILEGDPYLYILVDKQHALPEGYEPNDLVELTGGSYQVSREGLMLRRAAAASLEEMALAARKEGITLAAGSAYRSAAYQAGVYAREVSNYGQETADRESARPGYSQHQTGLAVDFAPIDDAFANTAAGIWLLKNAGSFGWSLSFPDGHEAVTGYRWESWHYRYVGSDLVRFIDTYFDGIQQYALQFINAWIESSEWNHSL
ncbi:MAG: M15 family metallopeptidase [Treponema sp.]|jgi:D-alanyl-D-alanine carboxypeptidase|nr:M15 family metallopeptidase [Treponema sp.]